MAVALFVLCALVPLVWLEVILPAGVPHPGLDYLLPAFGVAFAVSAVQGLLVVAGIGGRPWLTQYPGRRR